VVTKIPRFAFEKFPSSERGLGTQMRSVGEVMAIGRTFKESLQKALRSLELDVRSETASLGVDTLESLLAPNPMRLPAVIELLRRGRSPQALHDRTGIDPWFLAQLAEITEAEKEIGCLGAPAQWTWEQWREIKRLGFSDVDLARLKGIDEDALRSARRAGRGTPVYKTVDTCAAEFEAYTPYHYSTYEWEDEVVASDKPKVVILGSGPNRIGQGVEFDYATVHAVWALRDAGFETIMVNSNPETVSTDYDTADRLYFEPLTFEDVMNLVEHEKPEGVIVQLGGQTPLKLARRLDRAGVAIWGTPAAAIDRAEDRHGFHALCTELGIDQPAGGVAERPEDAKRLANEIGYPVMVRPSYVLGGRAMMVVRSDEELEAYLSVVYAELEGAPTILVDDFVEGAVELDVDALCDGERTVVAGIMEHVEGAGIHSGDSACIVPPVSLSEGIVERVRDASVRLAEAIGVRGLINLQFVVRGDELYVIEANPRASRTVPYLSKAIGHPLAKYAALIAAGRTLAEIGFTETPSPAFYSVKEVVLPFGKFGGVVPILGPEMRSTGESMGIDVDPDLAYYKAQLGAGQALPAAGRVRLIGDGLDALADDFEAAGFEVVRGPQDGGEDTDAALLIDVAGTADLRRALQDGVPYVTTREAAAWTLRAIRAVRRSEPGVTPLQDLRVTATA